MAILVTGGAGFIGANFVIDWAGLNDELVINLDKLTYAGHRESLSGVEGKSGYRFVHGDIGDERLVQELLSSYRPRAVINFAAESHVDRSISNAQAFIETNVVGTYRLLECARAYWSQLSGADRERFRFLHVSTDEVYGSLGPEDPPFCETTPYRPNSPYSASKAAADHLARAWHHTYGLPVLATNCTNNYGPYQYPEKLIPLMICNALAGQPLPVYGTGVNIRDWLYVKDHCDAIHRVLADGKPGETYCIGGNAERSNIDVVHTICDELDAITPRSGGGSYRAQIKFVTDRPGHDARYAMSCNKMRSQLGWQPSETFESGLRKTIRWYLNHQDWITAVTGTEHARWMAEKYGQASAR
jgi:dTDP-glucose 4,6-dehydratase